MTVDLHVLFEQAGEDVLREVEHLPLRNDVSNLRLQDIDAGVHQVREGFLLRGLLEEANHLLGIVQFDDSKLGGVFHPGQCEGCRSGLSPVELVELPHVDIGQDVTAGDDERVLDEVSHPFHGPGRSGGGRLERVLNGGVILLAVPDLLHHAVGHVARGDDYLSAACLPEGTEDVVDARTPGHG